MTASRIAGSSSLTVSPHNLVVDTVIRVPKNVSHTTETFPVEVRTKTRCFGAQPDGGLRNDLHLPLDRGLCLQISLVVLKAHVTEKTVDVIDRFQDVAEMNIAIPKRQTEPHASLVIALALASMRPTRGRPRCQVFL